MFSYFSIEKLRSNGNAVQKNANTRDAGQWKNTNGFKNQTSFNPSAVFLEDTAKGQTRPSSMLQNVQGGWRLFLKVSKTLMDHSAVFLSVTHFFIIQTQARKANCASNELANKNVQIYNKPVREILDVRAHYGKLVFLTKYY